MANTSPKRPRPIAAGLFVFGLLTTEAVLFASERFQWFAFNHLKGMTVLVTLALVGIAMLMFFVCIGIGRLLGRGPQFGLGTVFVLVLLTALPCAWLAKDVQKARRQRNLVSKIEREAGRVVYIDAYLGRPVVLKQISSSEDTPAPLSGFERLVPLLGHDFFFDIFEVQLGSSELIDELSIFENLAVLRAATTTTDNDLEKICRFRNLCSIELDNSQISDTGLECLVNLPHLEILYLNNTRISDKGLRRLSEIQSLNLVTASHSRVTDEGVEYLRKALPEATIGGNSLPNPKRDYEYPSASPRLP